MNDEHLKFVSEFISPTYLHQATCSRKSISNDITHLLTQRRIPDEGWTVEAIELFLREISLWDSNNFNQKSAMGEREGRCFSTLVSRRHWGMIHGIGRSGDVNAEQPKAAGSSFVLILTRILVRDLIKSVFGISNLPKQLIVLPVATGMSLMLGMTAVSQEHGDARRKHVLWSRIDQKSCIKAVNSDPNLTVHVIEQCAEGDGLVTDISRISSLVAELDPSTIHSIVLTTSVFAPRTPDDVISVSKLCKENNIPLIVNNAYGLQCSKCCQLINEALRVGRVDLVVQSTDKNLGVPVGGSILFGRIAERVNKIYPGRASLSPILDVLITILELGKQRLISLLKDRKENMQYMLSELRKIPQVKVLNIPKNQISVAMTTEPIEILDNMLGSELFLRNVSGARVFVRTDKTKTIDDGIILQNFGCHSNTPVVDRYINVACAIGVTKPEIDAFINRFRALLNKRSS